ncbi:MAG: hypothetical protein K1X47_09310, partial [Cyclobacteriaceae bacterium]|nr:hypothetical protein [Cyclobacteriaceae bacterium]
GGPIDAGTRDNLTVEIPSLSDFKITNVRVEQGGNQHLVIQFSDPLDEKQAIEGLISISELASLDYEIRDNEIHVYPPVRQTGTRTLTVQAGLRNVLNYALQSDLSIEVLFEQLTPAVRFLGKGNILPATDGWVMPFEAVSLRAIDVNVIKVFGNNMLQFLQVNSYDGQEELRRTGKSVLRKTIALDNTGITDPGKWNRFTLDLSKLIESDPGAMYHVRLSFKPAYSLYACDTPVQSEVAGEEENWSGSDLDESSAWDSYEDYYYVDGYDWDQRDNPCHISYYTGSRTVRRNVIASDLGLLAKRGGDGRTIVVVTDLRTAAPLSGVKVDLLSYQQQLLGTASTGTDGLVKIESAETPFFAVASQGAQRGYLRLQDGESLSLSNFDVGGEHVQRGIKGFIYGERGVWRPGDSLFLTFVLEDKLKLLPPAHPVVMELQNPQGQITSRQVRSAGENGFYPFAMVTRSDAPTGNWLARVKVGGTEFTQSLRVETVKPNRLKINLDFGVDKLTTGVSGVSGNLHVDWLHGTPGKNLKSQFELILTKAETKFARYSEYVFEDAQAFSREPVQIFEGYTDASGNAVVNFEMPDANGAPGVLNAVFRGKVFEEGGNFSIDRFSIPYYPFESFTGIRVPAGDKARGMLLTDTTHRVDVVTVDADGKPVSRGEIQMTLTKLDWRWWWDTSEGGANYSTGRTEQVIASGTVATANGKGAWNFKVRQPEWGRFLIRAYDPASGHATSKVVYIDWPGWAGRARGEASAATMLNFSSDKSVYTIGEKATLVIPGSGQGRALVSLENGSTVLENFWVETQQGDNRITFDVKPEMAPNIFAHVTLLQPHAQTANDLPIRLYGVIPVQVEDPETRLEPVISMPDVLEPGQEVVIKVSEKSKRRMTYTIAIVEEGLLDLTRYKTPDLWSRFYAREALGVRTWDLYDAVIGSIGGKLERLLAIGGDLAAGKEDDAKSNRFKPVVRYLGPFTLDGGSAEHHYTLPMYIGSVKTMVVAGYEGAYGKADKATPVRKPLMVLATLPRVLGPEEELRLPLTLFSLDKSIQQAKVELKITGPMIATEGLSQTVSLNGSETTVSFPVKVKPEIGWIHLEVTATSGSYKATDAIDVEVRNANPVTTTVTDGLMEAGKSYSLAVQPLGVAGTNKTVLEVSSMPPLNLTERLRYLIQYPHGCIEQTTSAAFPQLYVDQLRLLSAEETAATQRNVKAAIDRIRLFVTADGGFGYWPGNSLPDEWGTSYAGHFLVEADAKGYFVPHDLLRKWKRFQKKLANSWRVNNGLTPREAGSSELIQTYRLYTLALAGESDLGAMNRMRERPLSLGARWMLALAYAKAGQPEAAKQLIKDAATHVSAYQEMDYSYGSDLRDKAIILETLVVLGDRTRGFDLVKEIAGRLSNNSYWMSTQTTAWSLKAISSFTVGEKKGPLSFDYSWNGKRVSATTELPYATVTLADSKGTLQVDNRSGGPLFVRVIQQGVPARGAETDADNNLSMMISYTDLKGNDLDPSRLEQGQQFIAAVAVTNPGVRGNLQNLALTQIFPSGWEINNLRLTGDEASMGGDKADYTDIRDDRVYMYFGLNRGQRKVFKVSLTATYAGTYYLPAVSCEAMYDHSVYVRRKGMVTEVVKPTVN